MIYYLINSIGLLILTFLLLLFNFDPLYGWILSILILTASNITLFLYNKKYGTKTKKDELIADLSLNKIPEETVEYASVEDISSSNTYTIAAQKMDIELDELLKINVQNKAAESSLIIQKTFKSLSLNINDYLSQINSVFDLFHTSKDATIVTVEELQKSSVIVKAVNESTDSAFEIAKEVHEGVKELTTMLKQTELFTDQLLTHSTKIGDIINKVSDISQKTNVLAINASIVSARAGIHGKAFGVVAGEVRKLSASTENALQQIRELISALQSTINDVIGNIRNASKQIQFEGRLLDSVGGTLQGILLSIQVISTSSDLCVSSIGNHQKTLEQINNLLLESKQNILSLVESISSNKSVIEKSLDDII